MLRRDAVVAILASLLGLAACDTSTSIVVGQDTAPDTAATGDAETLPDSRGEEQQVPREVTLDTGAEALMPSDTVVDPPEQVGPACEAGVGCFGDKCAENADCLSGWCVEHMGEGVCSKLCTEECPAGWKCKQVAGTEPDLVFVCVSQHGNLCKPCSDGNDCKGVGGSDDVCLDYGEEGAFCGGACGDEQECPWGFSCLDSATVDGIMTTQCVADAGVCPCTGKSVELALWTPCVTANEFGECQGKRICTAQGLADCDALVPDAESCNGLDDDCDGSADEPNEVGGDLINLCDDGKECTDDTCAGEEGCQYVELDQGECKDGDVCTVGDHCEAGECVGLPIVCDDGNVCTDDLCDGLGGCTAEFNQEKCDDEDPCTVGDGCSGGECEGTPVDCECQNDADCAFLEDGDLCNGILFCDKEKLPYQCAIKEDTVIVCPGPKGADEICLKAACDPDTGACALVPDHEGFACEDGDKCTVGDNCVEGTCTAGVALNCNDGNPCTDDLCAPDTGCAHEDNQAPCSDGNACTGPDACDGGTCQGGQSLACDDGDVCNGVESCDPALGCQAGEPLVCDDGNICNGIESCDSDLGCQGADPLICVDGNPCTDDSCNADKGCVYTANDHECDDGNHCTEGDQCASGMCGFEGFLECADDNACTTDSCNPDSGCVYTLNQDPCDDGNPCTTQDHCELGQCIGGGQFACDDSNPCTDDSCVEGAGCQHLPNQGDCDDANECTTGDTCANGLCAAAQMLVCDDGNACTDDSCDPDSGCVNTPNDAPCSDGDDCTVSDACLAGLCQAGGPANCDDANVCTDDSCEPGVGCEHAANLSDCQDGDECTAGDKCANGNCIPGGPVVCDDDDFCNGVETCHPDVGCVAGVPPELDDEINCTVDSCDETNDLVVHMENDQACNNFKWCDGVEKCDDVVGCLAGTPPDLLDGHDCTVDTCDEVADQAVHTPDDALCDDNDECTVDSCDAATGCENEFSTDLCSYFDVAAGKIFLANGIFIKCFGGLTVTNSQVSCKFPLFNQENYSNNASQNTMLGLHNEGEQYAGGHQYIQEQIGAYVGYNGGRQVQMNESGPGGMWGGTGTHENEHCYANGQVLNWKQNKICHNDFGGGGNVLSSFVLLK